MRELLVTSPNNTITHYYPEFLLMSEVTECVFLFWFGSNQNLIDLHIMFHLLFEMKSMVNQAELLYSQRRRIENGRSLT